MSEISLKIEETKDYPAIESLTREAFWNHYGPGCNEHYLVHVLRESPAFIRDLDYVAFKGDLPVGNIMYTKAHVMDDQDHKHPVITFGPLSVAPDHQGQGIGGKLVKDTLKMAKDLGYGAVLIYGDPGYYSRLGFLPAETYDIATPDNMYMDPLQAYELVEGYLAKISGRFYEDPVFHVDQAEAEAYDKAFPPKEKLEGLPSQLAFLEQIKVKKKRGNKIES